MFGERGYGQNEEKKEKKSTVVLYLSSVAVLLYSHNGELTQQDGRGNTANLVWDKRDTFRQHFYLSYLLSYLKEKVSNSLVTFVTLKRFAVLFFLPSCCVNSLMLAAACTDTRARLSLHIVLALQTNLKLLICIY